MSEDGNGTGDGTTFTERYNTAALYGLIAVLPPLLMGWAFMALEWGRGIGIGIGVAVEAGVVLGVLVHRVRRRAGSGATP